MFQMGSVASTEPMIMGGRVTVALRTMRSQPLVQPIWNLVQHGVWKKSNPSVSQEGPQMIEAKYKMGPKTKLYIWVEWGPTKVGRKKIPPYVVGVNFVVANWGSLLSPHSYSSRWFQRFFIFYPYNWGNDPIWRAYFSDGLVPPPTR